LNGRLNPTNRKEDNKVTRTTLINYPTLQNSSQSFIEEKDHQTNAATAALQTNETDEDQLDEKSPAASVASTRRPEYDAQLYGDPGFQ